MVVIAVDDGWLL